MVNGKDPVDLPGPERHRRSRVRIFDPQSSDRPFDAQSARSAGLLARRQRQPQRDLLECFMDELAHSVGQDPLEFRRKLMTKNPKHLAVLNAVAEKIGWGTPAPKGVYRGLAQHMGFGSYVAGAAEISVTDGNKIKVHPHRRRDRPGLCRQSGADRPSGRRLLRLRPLRIVLWRLHRQGRPHRTGEFRHL